MIDWEKERHKFKNFVELFTFIEDNFVELYNQYTTGRKIVPEISFHDLEIFFYRLKYKDCVSNTHNSPKGKKTNWNRHVDLPCGYPGLDGRIRVQYKSIRYLYDMSELFRKLRIDFGSGGGGGCDYGNILGGYTAHCIIWEEEWPTIFATMREDMEKHEARENLRKYDHEMDQNAAVLAGKYCGPFRPRQFDPFKESWRAES